MIDFLAWFIIFVRFAMVPLHVLGEAYFARWLPWWRRYASVPFTTLAAVLLITHQDTSPWVALIGHAIFYWNGHTCGKNRNNDRDMRKLEAAQASQTAVEAAAWRRDVVEAR